MDGRGARTQRGEQWAGKHSQVGSGCILGEKRKRREFPMSLQPNALRPCPGACPARQQRDWCVSVRWRTRYPASSPAPQSPRECVTTGAFQWQQSGLDEPRTIGSLRKCIEAKATQKLGSVWTPFLGWTLSQACFPDAPKAGTSSALLLLFSSPEFPFSLPSFSAGISG